MKKVKIYLSIILISVILLACLALLGYFGIKTMRRTHLRMEAREAFAAEDWKKAEKLLNEYLAQDSDSEEDFVRLAQVYRHFGNTGEEMHCWYKAYALNPLKPEYWDKYTESAMSARDFGHLFSSLSRKVILHAELAPKDKVQYLICSAMTNRVKDAEQYYENMLKDDPEAFQRDDLARYAEFLVKGDTYSPLERTRYLENGIRSDDPVVRVESTLQHLLDLEFSDMDEDLIREQEEELLRQAVTVNRFAAIPFLANVYFSQMKFASVIEIAEPYLADIDNIPLSVIYAESCVYGAQPEKLKPLAEHFHTLGWRYRLLASYFDALYDFTQGVEKNNDLGRHMQEASNIVRTSLANLIELQLALNNDSVEKVCGSFETIMMNPPFCDVQERAHSAVRHYIEIKIRDNPAFSEDLRIIKLAQLMSGIDNTDPFLMRILVSDQRKRNILTRQILQDNLEAFPYDPYLLETAAEFELFNDAPEKCLEYIDRFYELKDEKLSLRFDLLRMFALELMGKIDEAAQEYAALVDNTEMDREVLYRYFMFCIQYKRRTELSGMADHLDTSDVPELNALAPFFRAEELLLQEKKDEALLLLETAETDRPDFALHAANHFAKYDMLDQALSRYLGLVDKYPDQQLIFANIAEAYLAKGMKSEALSYAKQAWEANQDSRIGQFVYAKMLAANGRYQDAEKNLLIPRRKMILQDEVRELWTDIMLHCVQDDLDNHRLTRALERTNHYLILYPDDPAFQGFKARLEQELKKESDFRNLEQ